MSVWLAIPSARPAAEAMPRLEMWRKQGYNLALYRKADDYDAEMPIIMAAEIYIAQEGDYPGWPRSANLLVREILHRDPAAEWIVTGGDDTRPDGAHPAEEIALDCTEHFTGTFGVMQPTGDRWGASPNHPDPRLRSAYIDRICGSPWMGREFCQRMYQGRGPLCEEYVHMFADEELQEVATKLGVLWQRRDLIHLHEHPQRKQGATAADLPDFLKPFNTPEHWQQYKALFERRKREGFPGSEPL